MSHFSPAWYHPWLRMSLATRWRSLVVVESDVAESLPDLPHRGRRIVVLPYSCMTGMI